MPWSGEGKRERDGMLEGVRGTAPAADRPARVVRVRRVGETGEASHHLRRIGRDILRLPDVG